MPPESPALLPLPAAAAAANVCGRRWTSGLHPHTHPLPPPKDHPLVLLAALWLQDSTPPSSKHRRASLWPRRRLSPPRPARDNHRWLPGSFTPRLAENATQQRVDRPNGNEPRRHRGRGCSYTDSSSSSASRGCMPSSTSNNCRASSSSTSSSSTTTATTHPFSNSSYNGRRSSSSRDTFGFHRISRCRRRRRLSNTTTTASQTLRHAPPPPLCLTLDRPWTSPECSTPDGDRPPVVAAVPAGQGGGWKLPKQRAARPRRKGHGRRPRRSSRSFVMMVLIL